MNIPLPAGTNSEEYLNAYEHVLKKLKEFKPEFVLFSAGFDAHEDDPLAQFKLKSKDFYDITKRTLEVANKSSNNKLTFLPRHPLERTYWTSPGLLGQLRC